MMSRRGASWCCSPSGAGASCDRGAWRGAHSARGAGGAHLETAGERTSEPIARPACPPVLSDCGEIASIGALAPLVTIKVTSPYSGTISSVSVDAGTLVKKGRVLAQLHTRKTAMRASIDRLVLSRHVEAADRSPWRGRELTVAVHDRVRSVEARDRGARRSGRRDAARERDEGDVHRRRVLIFPRFGGPSDDVANVPGLCHQRGARSSGHGAMRPFPPTRAPVDGAVPCPPFRAPSPSTELFAVALVLARELFTEAK